MGFPTRQVSATGRAKSGRTFHSAFITNTACTYQQLRYIPYLLDTREYI